MNAPRPIAEIEAELENLLPSNQQTEADEGSEQQQAATVAAPTPAEAAATLKGWVPKDQYKGDPTKWVDASTFIERGERFNHNLQREVAELKTKIASFEGTKQAFKKFHEETLAAKDAELKTAISELRLQRSQAIREGDDEVALQLEDRIELLRDEQREVKKLPVEQEVKENPNRGPNPEDPVLLEWIDDGNDWFKTDGKLRDYAVAMGEEMIKAGTTVRGRKFLDLVAEKMKEEFPRRFKTAETTSNERQPKVEGAAGGAASRGAVNNGKTEADLPEEDRALMKQFIKEGWTTKDTFLKSYFSRNSK